MNFAAVILAGGKGSRIGGEKPLKLLGGKRLIDRAAEFATQWSDVVAVAVKNPGQVDSLALTHIIDDLLIEGPLSGLAAALQFARACKREAALTIPADMPFLPQDLPMRLVRQLQEARASIAGSGGHLHPVCGLWRVAALDEIDNYQTSGRRSLKGFAEAIGFHSTWWLNEPIDPFFNINSASDLAAAERILGG